VAGLQKDPLVRWQHRHVHWLGAFVGFGLPSLLGLLWGGWASALGGLLIGGVARVVVLQHCAKAERESLGEGIRSCKHQARLPLRRCSFLPRRFAQRRRLDLFPGRTVRAFLVTPPEGAVVG
jgi:hypothetical protein